MPAAAPPDGTSWAKRAKMDEPPNDADDSNILETRPWKHLHMTEQLQAFDEQGYLFLPIASRRRRSRRCARGRGDPQADRPELWREKSGAPRTAFAAHTYNEGFRLLAGHPA